MAFRIITNSTRECYRCLGIIHRSYPYIHGRFKDFISAPKSNGYRALHTSVLGPKNKKIEIQFRSNVMNQIADFGVAAHWKYKDPKKIKDKDTKEYKWMHELVDLMNSSVNQDELIENSKINVFQDDIYVFTPKGDVIELPKNATPIDFANTIHTQIGDKCVGAKVNGKLQPLKIILKNGDQIEIITSEDSQPSPLWQRFAVTSKVKSQVRRFFRTKKREEHIIFGKQILISFFKKENYELNSSTVNKIKTQIELAIREKENLLNAKKLQSKEIDVEVPGMNARVGTRHPISITINEITKILSQFGFSKVIGDEIETEFYNFEALNIPKTHPARDMHDTFYINVKNLLRTHTSSVQIHSMEKYNAPIKIMTPGRVYRCDSDPTHSPMFHQIEGLYVDEGVSFTHLKGILEEFINLYFGKKMEIRFRPSYFPFTEPSAEIDIKFNNKWLEVLG